MCFCGSTLSSQEFGLRKSRCPSQGFDQASLTREAHSRRRSLGNLPEIFQRIISYRERVKDAGQGVRRTGYCLLSFKKEKNVFSNTIN